MPKDYSYRGYTLEELRSMSMDEFIRLLPSRQRRSMQRGLTSEQRILLESIRKAKSSQVEERKIIIKTHARNAVILPEMVGFTVLVHNGKEFIPVDVAPEMIGHYLGEFAITNNQVKHGAPGIGSSRSSMYVPLR